MLKETPPKPMICCLTLLAISHTRYIVAPNRHTTCLSTRTRTLQSSAMTGWSFGRIGINRWCRRLDMLMEVSITGSNRPSSLFQKCLWHFWNTMRNTTHPSNLTSSQGTCDPGVRFVSKENTSIESDICWNRRRLKNCTMAGNATSAGRWM